MRRQQCGVHPLSYLLQEKQHSIFLSVEWGDLGPSEGATFLRHAMYLVLLTFGDRVTLGDIPDRHVYSLAVYHITDSLKGLISVLDLLSRRSFIAPSEGASKVTSRVTWDSHMGNMGHSPQRQQQKAW